MFQLKKYIFHILVAGILFGGLYLSSLYHYLLFHTLAETFSVIVACSVFMLAWNARSFMQNHYLLFLGIAYFFVGTLDLLHTLSYAGINVIDSRGGEIPTQLWIAGRYLKSISLLVSPIFLTRKFNPILVFSIYIVITVVLLLFIFSLGWFPSCYSQDTGLTLFKRISEYIICGLFLLTIMILSAKRMELSPTVFRFIVISICLSIISELCFTLYVGVYDIANMIGHYFKIIAYFYIYKALIEVGLKNPYELLFHDLKTKEEALRETTSQLQLRLDEREKLIAKLQEAAGQIKTLSGLIPICSSCKKIRDDEGFWESVETYVQDHSDATFSHGICPDCARKLYPQYADKVFPAKKDDMLDE